MIEPVQVLGQPAMRLRGSDGAQATVLLHGGQIVSWIPAGDIERLYLSPQAVAGPGQAVRGGIPVIFPQFERRGTLPRHGFARTMAWQWVEGHQRAGAVTGVLRLTDDETTRALWPHRFEAELSLSLSGLRLDVELAVDNTGDAPFSFTAALHTYLRCDDVLRARLSGLYGTRYVDSLTGQEQRQEIDPQGFVGEIDRIYFDAREPLSLSTAFGRMRIEQEGFDDVVVWNPGPQKAAALADLSDDGWLEMLCVEAACIGRPVKLAPGSEWVGRQAFEA
ncbi:D-hexose-6-phosphate mutarotase [Aquincola sp. S2]|uniref:Putative glucose-6-phosphate 1-epimerase n=1 Tax=Pseudaquabacterium terrae TaxID=2732868 RepID=A0ABX2EC82_9BURK|nr:D-hexose-6-phosphate mutarotase [Aquabacterium terrae]NRF66739.1 D-hexose-6-phosphate mutarotase [Aquabacterium terrae]